MQTVLVVLHLIICMALIIIVLLQTGKGSEIGAVFGGSSQTLFGSSGGSTFFSKLTTGVAIVFLLTSLILAGRSSRYTSESVMSDMKPAATVPAATESQAVAEVPLEESEIPPVTTPAAEKETPAPTPERPAPSTTEPGGD